MNFFVNEFNSFLGYFDLKPLVWPTIILPLGISFITFQKLACTLDVAKKRFVPFRNLPDYALYIFMFPQLLSGPIVRPSQVAGQIAERSGQETVSDRLVGFSRFVIGLAKKVLVADVLALQVNAIFELNSLQLSSGMAWIGAIAFTFQIYFDFSGYTDMALGLARLLGFRLPENFNFPYVSQSITEFWRRWHMTLSLWFRDYVFLPLAYSTSRALPKEKYFGLRADKIIYLVAATVTFLLCGFWHGAALKFIFWGGYQGLFLVLDRLFLLKFFRIIGKIPSMLITFSVTVIGWVMFRSEGLHFFYFYVRRMFMFTGADNAIILNPEFWTMMIIAIIFSFLGISKNIEQKIEQFYDIPRDRVLIPAAVISLLLLILCEAAVSSSGFSPAIYLKF